MEPKVVFYIIIGVLYFLYSMSKKAAEEKQKNSSAPPKGKPVSPPSAMKDILQEIKRAQEAKQAKQQTPAAKKPQPAAMKAPSSAIPVEEGARTTTDVATNKSASAMSGMKDKKLPVFQAPASDAEVYGTESIEEAEARESAPYNLNYLFNARDAIIGSIILERKY